MGWREEGGEDSAMQGGIVLIRMFVSLSLRAALSVYCVYRQHPLLSLSLFLRSSYIDLKRSSIIATLGIGRSFGPTLFTRKQMSFVSPS